MTINNDVLNLARDPFVMLMLTAKAACNDGDLTSLLSDPVKLTEMRDERLHEANTADMDSELSNPDAAKFILLMTDVEWRKENMLQGGFEELPYAFGELVTSDQHLSGLIQGDELIAFQGAVKSAVEKFSAFNAQ